MRSGFAGTALNAPYVAGVPITNERASALMTRRASSALGLSALPRPTGSHQTVRARQEVA